MQPFASLARWFLRLAFVALGAVVALAVLVSLVGVVAAFLARSGWARLTGRQPAAWPAPGVVDPRERFRRAYDMAGRFGGSGAARAAARPKHADVTDVVPRRVSAQR